jgi:phosphoribosylaminoimidazolecarboxamide formyltransferase/IMP cyclohydrolase
VERALLSVDDKSGLADLARGLLDLHVELWATGGTRRSLTESGLRVGAAEELTGIADWFGGRVKTLHPALLGGILAPRTDAGRREMAERNLKSFDLVVVNFYPFERHLAAHPDATDREEYIDIGGVTLARAAAKNHAWVTVLTDPADYPGVLGEMRASGGVVSGATRARLAEGAFRRTAAYDAAIYQGLRSAESTPEPFPESVTFRREPIQLRYGENPHQKAAVYRQVDPPSVGFVARPFRLLKGDSLSYTNLLDSDTALSIVAEFPGPTVAVVKHATPCGVASGATVREAVERAIATDPVARYGCAIAVNRPVVAPDLEGLKGVFVDLLAAPGFDPDALAALGHRPKVKVVETETPSFSRTAWEARGAYGRVILQEEDHRELQPADFKLVTGAPASPEGLCALDFGWRVVRHAKSNAIVLAQGSKTVGIGSGQPTRVKAVELAVEVAGDRAKAAGKAGVASIIQPGGSLRDPEVIAMAEKYGISMYFTGWRIFRH